MPKYYQTGFDAGKVGRFVGKMHLDGYGRGTLHH
jgi:hypothetical protein